MWFYAGHVSAGRIDIKNTCESITKVSSKARFAVTFPACCLQQQEEVSNHYCYCPGSADGLIRNYLPSTIVFASIEVLARPPAWARVLIWSAKGRELEWKKRKEVLGEVLVFWRRRFVGSRRYCLSVPVVNIATAPDTVNFVRRAPRHWPAIVFLRNFRESRSGNHKSLGKGMGRLYTMQLESIRWLPLMGCY